MSILASLVRAYERLPDQPPFGFSVEKVSFVITLNADGTVASVIDWRDDNRKRTPRLLTVPQAVKRTAGIAPNFLWDKSAYVLGVTAGKGRRTAEEHAAFRRRHAEWLEGTDDEGLCAFLRFLEKWSPDQFVPPLWPEEVLDRNIVFALAGEYRERCLHDRPEARKLWQRIGAESAAQSQTCLVTGKSGPVARLHPSVKGVWGAQSSGASLVSFNLDAFTSYGHDQGDNAPVSEAAAFAYTTALNRFLEKDSGHRIQIGDASTVFWADASDVQHAAAAETLFSALFANEADTSADDRAGAKAIGVQLERIRQGQHISQVVPDLAQGVRFHVLGLAPNAARLSIRFFWEDDFGNLTGNYQRFLNDIRTDPPPRGGHPALWRYLVELAAQNKRENVPPALAGEWMRAILAGTPYPITLLSTTLMRIRADGRMNGLRAGMLKSVLIRNFKREVPVVLSPEERNRGYVLGRLFAVYEAIQRAALGDRVNATIRDRFYGAASASPRRVFAMLESGSANHLSKLRKHSPGHAVNLERDLRQIAELMEPGDNPFPPSLGPEEQALFGLGYHHQNSAYFSKRTPPETTETETAE